MIYLPNRRKAFRATPIEVARTYSNGQNFGTSTGTGTTWHGQSIGAAPTGGERRWVLAVSSCSGTISAANLSSFNIDGTDRQVWYVELNAFAWVMAAITEISTGTTADFQLNWSTSAAMTSMGLYVHTLRTTGAVNETPYDSVTTYTGSGTTRTLDSINVEEKGAIVCTGHMFQSFSDFSGGGGELGNGTKASGANTWSGYGANATTRAITDAVVTTATSDADLSITGISFALA